MWQYQDKMLQYTCPLWLWWVSVYYRGLFFCFRDEQGAVGGSGPSRSRNPSQSERSRTTSQSERTRTISQSERKTDQQPNRKENGPPANQKRPRHLANRKRPSQAGHETPVKRRSRHSQAIVKHRQKNPKAKLRCGQWPCEKKNVRDKHPMWLLSLPSFVSHPGSLTWMECSLGGLFQVWLQLRVIVPSVLDPLSGVRLIQRLSVGALCRQWEKAQFVTYL